MLNKISCNVCNALKDSSSVLQSDVVNPTTVNLIKKSNSNWNEQSTICIECLNKYRADQIKNLLTSEKGRLSSLEKEVVESIRVQDLITENPNIEYEGKLSIGDRIADKVAEFGGSWKFIISFTCFIGIWIAFNSIQFLTQAIDPFPFILLNLVLSCLTALQAPIIMMSQNRQSEKDRIKSELEYQINLKAELQTRQIMRRLDQFMTQQWQKFLEIQELQNEMKK